MKQLELNFETKEAEKLENSKIFKDNINKKEKGFTQKDFENYIATRPSYKESNGAWAKFVADNKEAVRKDEELAKAKEKPRQENALERINRINYQHGDSKKRPAHLDNKNIKTWEEDFYPKEATPEQVGKLAERLERSRQMSGQLSTWDLMKETAKTPEEKNELKRILNKQYYKRGPKDMDPEDLKYIGKHKSQTQTVYPKIEIPRVGIDESLISKPTRQPEPEISLTELIKIRADERLKKEQRAWDHQHGRSGITDLLRPI